MKTLRGASALLVGAWVLGGCAASASQGAQVRVHSTSAAFVHQASSQSALAQRSDKPSRKESPLAHACKAGSSKSCNELGDRLAVKHAYGEALQWYASACQRVRASMEPNAARLLQLSRDLNQPGSSAARTAELKSDAAEIKARIQGCFDAGEMVKADGEPRQALSYYDAVCEFSSLVATVGESVAGLEHLTESGCAADQALRAKLSSPQFSPTLFADALEQHQAAANAKRAPAQGETDMVFTMGEL